ncbi:sensor histidine kinase [Aquipuribacter sp. SD81]|uniref:sensor histidine kinase n=1 Tax=Aquipuribacter sp. SD81 TaxID=3127703 RepID=UPI003017DF02
MRAAVSAPLERALVVLAAVLAAGAALMVVLVHAGPLADLPLAYAFVGMGCLYAVAGLLAWWRRPANRLGALLTAAGLATWAASLANTGDPVLVAVGTVTAVLPVSVVLHLLHATPSGRVEGRVSHVTVAAAYVLGLVLQAPHYLFRAAEAPYDLLVVADRPGLALAGERAQQVLGAVVVVVTAAVLLRRLRTLRGRQRWVMAPLFAFGLLAAIAVPLVARVVRPLLGLGGEATAALQVAALSTVPLAFLVVVLLGGFARTSELGAYVTALTAPPGSTSGTSSGASPTLDEAMAATLGDPDAVLLRRSADGDGYVDADGRPAALPDDGRSTIHVAVGDRRVGAVVHDARLGTDPATVLAVGRVTAIALEREMLAREVLASRAALREASSRLLSETDRERRRIARDLHDGLQVSLVRMSLQVGRLAQEAPGAPGGALVTRLAADVDEAATALRALVQGVMPAPLVERGLAAAVRELAYDLPVRARLELDEVRGRLPSAVESTAYFIVAEALTNVVKHAGATDVHVVLRRDELSLVVEVADDGRGGARADGTGTGLTGLRDRVDVLGGTLAVDSGPGGTRLRAVLPCG